MALATAGPGHAQIAWIGKPTIGDNLRRDLAQVADAWRRLRDQAPAAQAFAAENVAARKAFFAAAPDSEARAVAGRRFAELLHQKDKFNVVIAISGLDALGVLLSASGTQIDGGGPEAVRPAFRLWVAAVSRDVLAAVPDRARVAAALVRHDDAYQVYRAEHDQVEIQAHLESLADAQGA
ncbi:MAG: hypothetical protein JNL30_00085 [Rubrivivax sp.]|nr:hypothetical protein [Rubrivivax sp.]